MKLRNYQLQAIEAINNMQLGECGICQLPTGSGKTILMADLVKSCKNRILIIVQSDELYEQTYDKFTRYNSCDTSEIGRVQGRFNEVDKRIVIATRQSLDRSNKRIEDILSYGNNFDYILIDECHIAVDMQQRILSSIPHSNTIVVGMSATPFSSELQSVYSKIVYRKPLHEMVEEGYLSDIKYYKVDTGISLNQVKKSCGDFNLHSLEVAINIEHRNRQVVEAYKEYASERNHIAVFCVSIDHAKKIAEEFNLNGISAKSIDSTLNKDDRKQILDEFRQGKFKVLCNCEILTVGFDMPQLDCIILARMTMSKALYLQMIGRALRLHPTKENAMILDICDNCSKHDIMSVENIFNMKHGETLKEAKKNREREKKEKEEREEAERLAKEEEEKLRLKQIELFNKNIDNFKEFSTLDWFSCEIFNTTIFTLYYNFKRRFYIVPYDNKFYLFENRCGQIEYLFDEEGLLETISYAEEQAIKEGKTVWYKYYRNSFKTETASDKQRAYLCKYFRDLPNELTKWVAQQYFEQLELEKFLVEIEYYI